MRRGPTLILPARRGGRLNAAMLPLTGLPPLFPLPSPPCGEGEGGAAPEGQR